MGSQKHKCALEEHFHVEVQMFAALSKCLGRYLHWTPLLAVWLSVGNRITIHLGIETFRKKNKKK